MHLKTLSLAPLTLQRRHQCSPIHRVRNKSFQHGDLAPPLPILDQRRKYAPPLDPKLAEELTPKFEPAQRGQLIHLVIANMHLVKLKGSKSVERVAVRIQQRARFLLHHRQRESESPHHQGDEISILVQLHALHQYSLHSP